LIESDLSNAVVTPASATIHITKLAAAQRQLRAAIRMFFSGEDELAIHTVASAVYRVLSDLKSKRGRNEAGDLYLTVVLYCVGRYRSGTLPDDIKNNETAMTWIREVAEKIPTGTPLTLDNFEASVSPDVAKDFWQKRTKVSNFLKHADRDAKSHISLDEVDNLALLTYSVGAYMALGGDGLAAEVLAFSLYTSVVIGGKERWPPKFLELANKLEKLDSAKRLAFCSHLIQELGKQKA